MPAVRRPPLTITQLVMYCGGMRIFDPIHFSPEIARANGFPDVIANGSMRVAFLAQLVTESLGPADFLRSLTCRHRGMILIGDEVVSRGRIVRTWIEAGVVHVEAEVWNETARAGRADVGIAVVTVNSQ